MSKNINSFMAVINGTQQDGKDLVLPGDWFPSGRPLRGEGATLLDLQKRDKAEQWFQIAKGKYEREIEERDHQASVADAPELVIGGGDTPAEQPRAPEVATAPVSKTLEEELQGRYTRWEAECDQLKNRLASIEDEYREAKKQLTKCETALDAIRES